MNKEKTYLNKGFIKRYFLGYVLLTIAKAKFSQPTIVQKISHIFPQVVFALKKYLKSTDRKSFNVNKIRLFLILFLSICLSWWFYIFSSFGDIESFSVQQIQGPPVSSSREQDERLMNFALSQVSKLPLEARYRVLAGRYYPESATPYLSAIDKVLTERGLQDNELFIKGMFYVGEHESHWTPNRISSKNIKGGHPTGIFQFLPGTFRSVSNGDIFSVEDQVGAFVTMWERYRCDEFQVVFVCGWQPCLESEIKNYLLKW